VNATVIALVIIAAFLVSSLLGVYSYGHFARRARGQPSSALPVGEPSTALDSLVDRLETPDPDDTGFLLLDDNLDAFAARALGARNAGRSLDLLYYMWKDDLTGDLLAQEVIAAADRGVRVRLLLDDINTRDRDPIYVALDSHENIEVRLFNPTRARGGGLQRGIELILRLGSTNRRMHNKAWIADGRVAIVGGRNVGDAYFDAASTNFRDLDLLMIGAAVGQVEHIFDDFWNSDASLPIRRLSKLPRTNLPTLRSRFERLAEGEHAGPYRQRVRDRVSVKRLLDAERLFWSKQVQVISDPPEKAAGAAKYKWLMPKLHAAIDAATKEVNLISPYFVPGEEGASWIEGLARKGIDVAVLTNSLAATDVAAVHGGYAPYRLRLLKAGVKLFELQPYQRRSGISVFGSRGASLHTKAFMVDGRRAFLGSFNFDPRSASLNTEMGVLFEQEELIAELNGLFKSETSPTCSYRLCLGTDDRFTWEGDVKGTMRTFRHEPGASLSRRIIARIVTWLPVESML
jgi:putative cardiolipin synthase